MELSTKYNPKEVEEKWYKFWIDKGYFKATINKEKEAYTIVIPPPNVTGVLHMGHMLNNTIQDVLIRKARMEGKEACWVPGTDHASIATEAKVVAMLREQGIKKSDLSREEFLKHAWVWKEKYGGIILQQLKKLGASCDWDRTSFTMDPDYYEAVIKVFIDLYHKGYIYRGLRMINWDCEAKTALSNEEVIYKEDGEKSILYSVKYQIENSTNEWVVISTQRPETIMGDTAIAVNPGDERYRHLIGKKALVPFINRSIPIIADDYVDKEFGTGCLKVTPAHDPNDYEIGLRHQLQIIDTINGDGTLNEKCEVPNYVGKDRFAVRKLIVKDLKAADLLVKEEEFVTRIGRSERTNTVVEPKLSLQWFIRMKEISGKALQAVENGEVVLHPAKFVNTYKHWMENVRDWCISRQLWWGHQIPAYYYGSGPEDFVVASSFDEAINLASVKSGRAITKNELRQDDDVLDTWASSWLWPIQVFKGFDDKYFDKASGKIKKDVNEELDYFYPTKVLVTAPEILFFWVARMLIAGYEYMDKAPFKDVYLTGIVRDKLGRKMSKSLGNSPDPLELIQNYGADAVRTGMLFSSPAGNDLPYDEKLVEQGRNFANKIWNAFRLVKGWEIVDAQMPATNNIAINWFEARFNESLAEIEEHFNKFRISDALLTVYRLIWDDFCSWYLEMVKPEYGAPIDKESYNKTILYFEHLLKVLHPYMPFITEELWQALQDRKSNQSICTSSWPIADMVDKTIIKEANVAFDIISEIRNIRNQKGVSPKEKLALHIKGNTNADRFFTVISKLSNLSSLEITSNKIESAAGFVIGGAECYVPLNIQINVEEEKKRITTEIDYLNGFLLSIEKKLGNEKFVSSAPAQVVETEKKKKADAELKIKALQENLARL
jgi:valyl-tRNA synthetase